MSIEMPDQKPAIKPQSDYLAPVFELPVQPGLEPTPRITRTPFKRRRERPSKKRIIWAIILILAVFGLSVGGWIGYKFVKNALKATNGNLLGILSDTKLNGESTGRVNVLLAGNSSDDPGHGGGELTDSLIIASIDTKNNSAYLLSIPRDTWVAVPGYGHQKINAVYPEGGMDLLEQVVEADFGVDINYYALVNYTAFKQAVDAVGGIRVNIQSTDSRGIYDPNIAVDTGGAALRLKNGVQSLDGQTALNLARARNDPTPSGLSGYGLPGGDFDRATNQRLMLTALKDKAASTTTLANPVKISELLDAIGDNVKTTFSAGDLRRLYTLSKQIPSSNISSLSLQDSSKGVNLLANYTSPDGQAALTPAAGLDDFSDIQSFIKRANSNDPAIKEGARIVVLNGSGQTGLAKSEAQALQAKNLNVTDYANAPATTTNTQIIVRNTSKPQTLSLLKKALNVSSTTSNAELLAQYPKADFIVVLGTNVAATPLPNTN